jgi:hypothetical protein
VRTIQWREARIPARDGFVAVKVCPLCGAVVVDSDLHEQEHEKRATDDR